MGLWSGVEVWKNSLKITHLQYNDDTLIFCDASIESLKGIKCALILFHLASGLQVNYHKSSVIGINISNAWLSEAATPYFARLVAFPSLILAFP